MKRVIIHWTGGNYTANDAIKRAYHFIVEGDGNVISGEYLPESNLDVSNGQYAAHTRALNTGSIGVAFAAMFGAQERPFIEGEFPITEAQVSAMAELVADLCDSYGIAVTRETVLTHAEVSETLGVPQRGKWDVAWLPEMGDYVNVSVAGDILRKRIAEKLQGGAAVRTENRIPTQRVEDKRTALKKKYVKPNSVTWWSGVVPLIAGLIVLSAPLHGQQWLVDTINGITKDTPASLLISYGLTAIGLRGKDG